MPKKRGRGTFKHSTPDPGPNAPGVCDQIVEKASADPPSNAAKNEDVILLEPADLRPPDADGNRMTTGLQISSLDKAPRESQFLFPETRPTEVNPDSEGNHAHNRGLEEPGAPSASHSSDTETHSQLPNDGDLQLVDQVEENDAMELDQPSNKVTFQYASTSRKAAEFSFGYTAQEPANPAPQENVKKVVLPTSASCFVPARKRPSNEPTSRPIHTTPEKQPKHQPRIPSSQPPQVHPQERHPWKDILPQRQSVSKDLTLLPNDSLFPVHPKEAKSVLGSTTPKDVSDFRRRTHDWYKERVPEKDTTPTEDPLVTTKDKPSGPVALYIVSKFAGRKALLTAVNIDLYLPDRADLRLVALSVFSSNTLQQGAIEPRDHLVIGDIIFVQKMLPSLKLKQYREGTDGKPPRETTLDDSLSRKYSVDWNVEEYQVFTRDQLEKRLAIVEGQTPSSTLAKQQELQKTYRTPAPRSVPLDNDIYDVAVEGHIRLIRTTYKKLTEGNACQSGDTLGVLVFTPLSFPFLFSSTPELKEQRTFLAHEYSKAGRQQYFGPSIVKTWKLNEFTESTLRNRDNLWGTDMDKQEACLWLYRGFSLGICGQEGIQNRYEDLRTHRLTLEASQQADHLAVQIVFNIQHDKPRVKAWTQGVRIVAGTRGLKIPGEVTMTCNSNEALTVSIKFVGRAADSLWKEYSRDPKAFFTIRQITGVLPRSTEDFFCQPATLDINEDGARFHQAARAIFGGPRISLGMVPSGRRDTVKYNGQDIRLTEEQARIVSAITDSTQPFVVAASFGCGKTWLANLLQALRARTEPEKLHIIVSQSNFAVINAVESAAGFDDSRELGMLRLITPQNYSLQTERTEFDLPALMRKTFLATASKLPDGPDRRILFRYIEVLTRLEAAGTTTEKDVGLEALLEAVGIDKDAKEVVENAQRNSKKEKGEWKEAVELFFELYKPRRIFATTASLIAMVSPGGPMAEMADEIELIIFDEASQLPAGVLAHFAHTLPNARPVLIGDRRQLPPFKPVTKATLLTDLASGDILSEVLDFGLWTHLPLAGVFRNHPWTTKLLSNVFYESRLVSAVVAERRSSYVGRIWMPNPDVPAAFLHVLDGQQENLSGGSSLSNYNERYSAREVANILAQHYGFNNIAILCLYREQADLLRRLVSGTSASNVFIATVDASQGREFDATIICTTRSDDPKDSCFFTDRRRCNVALSRTKELMVVLGNLTVLRNVQPWREIMETVDDYEASSTDKRWIKKNNGQY